ncbi:hypothetical protein FRC02_003412 [Tulasnella sp. 418]|nr:hypothetical protein FRC02_003412 [Tulasnella sp. 418]
MSSLISCTHWVKRGVAVQNPKKYDIDEKELERVSKLARIELEEARKEWQKATEAAKKIVDGEADNDDEWEDEPVDADEDGDISMDSAKDETKKTKSDPNDLSEYNLDSYDDDTKSALGPFSNIKGLTYHQNNDDDPYITLKEDDEDEERQELEILPSDNLIVIAKTEDDISQLEIYVYEESEENLYVHHDLMLPSFPLCLEWLDFAPSTSASRTSADKPGNYIAVGTFEPEIEIWSLDTVEAIYPDAILGRQDKTKAHIPVPSGTGKKKKKKTKAREISSDYHVDAVLGLSWNRTHRNLLASCSADKTVKLWDLNRDCSTEPAIRSFNVHKDKVQAVEWNQKDPTVLLTGSYDRTVRTFDTRTPDAGVGSILGADVEALKWDPWESHSFYVSLENGLVLNFDARNLPSSVKSAAPARFTLSAHDGAVSGLDVNPHIRGCIATGGTDKIVKVWNVNERDGKLDVSLVTSRDLGAGKVFSVTWSPDDPLTLAAAGSQAKLQIWDVGANMGVRRAFGSKLQGKEFKERSNGGVVAMANDNEDESGDEDADEP